MRSSASMRPENSISPHQTVRPVSLSPSRRSMTSTARESIYSQDDEKTVLLPTHNETLRDENKLELDHRAEQIGDSASVPSGGQRTETIHPRGCESAASLNDQARWKIIVQRKLGYTFRDVDLLEEALESEGSGVTSVGESRRHFVKGNRALARVGKTTMKLVLREQGYRLYSNKDESNKTIKSLLCDYNLYQLGKLTKLEQYIRPFAPMRPSERTVIGYLKRDLTALGKDSQRQIASGIRAMIGAVFFDGGFESAKRVMAHLELIIKLGRKK